MRTGGTPPDVDLRSEHSRVYPSVDTVKTHMLTMFRELGVTNRTQAALAARELRLHGPTRR